MRTYQGHDFLYHRPDGGFCKLCGLQYVRRGGKVCYVDRKGEEYKSPPACPVGVPRKRPQGRRHAGKR